MTSGIWAMASGTLTRDPERRTSSKGSAFATASIRIGSGDDAAWVNLIAFNTDVVERLLTLRAGDGVSAAGRAEVRNWTSREGSERSSLSITASEITAARPLPKQPQQPRNAYTGRSAAKFRQPRPALPSANKPPPLDDGVDDLWREDAR